jgi:hypothetical protein
MNFVFFAALLLNDFIPHNAEFPGFKDEVSYIDYTPNQSEFGIPENGLFIRASLGYLGEETEPIQVPRLTPPTPWPGPWPGGTDTKPRYPEVQSLMYYEPTPDNWKPSWVTEPPCDPATVPEAGSFILLGSGLFLVIFAGEMGRRYRDALDI